MKVLFVIENFKGGGAERVISLISGELAKRGHDVSIMTNVYEPFKYSIDKNVSIVPLIKDNSKVGFCRWVYTMIRSVRANVRATNYDVVVSVLPLMTFVTWVATVGLKVRKIASDHTTFDRKLSRFARFIRSYVYAKFDAVTVLSQTDCDYLGSKLPKKVFIPNPLAYTPIDNYSDKKNVVLAVGRLNVWHVKGFDILIEAWSLIAKKHPTWSLEIAGDGSRENKQKLLEIIRKFGIENSVVLSGFHNDIDRVMRRSKIFVMSSRTEGFGLTLVEAMSQGCACVSFDCGGRQSEIIRSADEGIILKECNAQALAAAIDNLINNPSEIEQLAQNGVVRSRDYNLLNITNQWETLLQKVAHSARN